MNNNIIIINHYLNLYFNKYIFLIIKLNKKFNFHSHLFHFFHH